METTETILADDRAPDVPNAVDAWARGLVAVSAGASISNVGVACGASFGCWPAATPANGTGILRHFQHNFLDGVLTHADSPPNIQGCEGHALRRFKGSEKTDLKGACLSILVYIFE